MNISELDSYNLDDAVKFNDQLNPRLWDDREHLRPEVRERLLAIAEDFKEFLGLTDLDVKDITISGSNAAYTYTPNSDIDLHIVAAVPEDEVYRELFDAKKGQYNDQHNITIGGNDVELYVETAGKPPISQGMYSVLNNDWIQVPRRAKSNIDDVSTKNKFESVGRSIERAVKSGNLERMDRLARKIKRMRQTGLENHGEFGPENLAFKILRSQGLIKQLYDARIQAKDQLLSLEERSHHKSVFTYGFKHKESVEPTVVEAESVDVPSDEAILEDFIRFCVAELKIKSMPTIKLRRDPQWPVMHTTFGRYINDEHLLEVAWGHRHIMDVLRTVAHELTHSHQHERDGAQMDNTAGETGSPWENEANARAGILMRDYARMHPEYFAVGQAEQLSGDEIAESASGYIPTKAQARDPRYSMALTQDIRPGQVGKEANKLKLRTNSQGIPQTANPNGLFENLYTQYQQYKEENTMKIREVAGPKRTLGGFAVKPLHIEDSGVAESANSLRANMVQQQLDVVEKIKSSNLPDVVKLYLIAINDPKGAVVKAAYRSFPKGQEAREKIKDLFVQKYNVSREELENADSDLMAQQSQGVAEAIKLDAPQRKISRDELQGYADRIKTGTKTKQDKFAPIIHGSNIKAIVKDDGGTEWDLDDLAAQITTRPRAILGTNAKMEKSKTEGEIVYDLTLPALSGIVVDEDTGDFVEITTCPGAGACQLFCYARKGGYVMFPASSMSAAQALNFLVNDPEGYTARVNQEIKTIKTRSDKAGIQLVVRWHDAGDFFSKQYLDLAYGVAEANPDVQFYAYTKMGDVATGGGPANFTMNFSSGSKRGEEKKVEFHRSQGNVVKQGVTVPKDMFFDLIARKGNSLIKDAKGRTQFASPEALDTFKQRLAQKYQVPVDSIITYDQMLATPVGTEPQWNVIVQPGAGDRAANRRDVIDSYLMFH